ncbi:MAG: toxin-antitoxin system YwqK family antitoxin [Cryomorphaceae bacterium]|nr:hypothetical protein [Flavobacteriales bacterium]
MMKIKILGIGILAMALVTSASAQDLTTKSDYADGQLVAMSGTERDYYIQKDENFSSENGLKTGKLISFHANGALEETGMLIKDKRFGTWKKYSDSGKLLTEAHFVDGKKDGVWKVWDENGTLRLQFSYDQGKRVGSWLMYDAEGKLISEKEY